MKYQTTRNVKMKRNIWKIGWKITVTRQKPFVFQGLILLFSVLLWPDSTLAAKPHEMCVKHAFSEPVNQGHRLFEKMEQHQKNLHRMQKSTDNTLTNLMRYSNDCQEAFDILQKGNGYHGGMVNSSLDFLALLSCCCFMMIVIFTFIVCVERKKLNSIKSKKVLCKDQRKVCRHMNYVRATAQTKNRDQDKVVPSFTGFTPSAKSTLVQASDRCRIQKNNDMDDLLFKSTQQTADTSPDKDKVKDLWGKDYPLPLTPDLPTVTSNGLTELDGSKYLVSSTGCSKTFIGTNYCDDSTNLKQIYSVDDTDLFVNDTTDEIYTCPKSYLMEVASDSECTGFDDNAGIKFSTSISPTQIRSLSDSITSFYTSNLSSTVPESGETDDMNDNTVKKCDSLFENILEESLLETEILSESENVEERVDMQDIKKRNTLENFGVSSYRQKVKLDLFLGNFKESADMNVNMDTYCNIHKGKDEWLTNSTQQIMAKPTEPHCNSMEEPCKAKKEDKNTLFSDEQIQSDVDDGTIGKDYVVSVQNRTFHEKAETMMVNDTLDICIAPLMEPTGRNLSDEPTSLKLFRKRDRRRKLSDKASVRNAVSEDERYSYESIEMEREICTDEKLPEISNSFIRLNKVKSLQGNDKKFTLSNTKEGHGKLNVKHRSDIKTTLKETVVGNMTGKRNDVKVEEKSSNEAEETSIRNGFFNDNRLFSKNREKVKPAVKKKTGHTEPDITGKKLKCGVAPAKCISKKGTSTVGYTQTCLTSKFKTDGKERDPGFEIIEHVSVRGQNSQVSDHSKNVIDKFGANLKENVRNECQSKQKSSSGPRMKIQSVDCCLQLVPHQRFDKSKGYQKKHRYQSRLKNERMPDFSRMTIDLVSEKTDNESVSGLPSTAKQKTNSYTNTTNKDDRKLQTEMAPCDYKGCITGIGSFLQNQQKNLICKVGKNSHFPYNHKSLFQFSQSRKQNRNLDKDKKVKSAIGRRKIKKSHCTWRKHCSSFDKSLNRGFVIQQGLPNSTELENDVAKMKSTIISNGPMKQSKGKPRIPLSRRCSSYNRNISDAEDQIDYHKIPIFESSSADSIGHNFQPALGQVVRQTVGGSVDSGLGTIESYRSDVISEMDTLEHAFHDNKVKLFLKKQRKLKRNLRKNESEIKKELFADYMDAIFNPLYFRPELSSIIAYPGLQKYFEKLDEGPLSREESLRFEWLRLESLKNYNGVGSIIQLARGGFYHDPVDGPLSTKCFACNIPYSTWEYFDDVTEVHRRLSLYCPHLRENITSGNVSIDNGPISSLPNRTRSSVTVETPEDLANEHETQSADTVSGVKSSLRDTQIRDMVAEGFPQQTIQGLFKNNNNRFFSNISGTGLVLSSNKEPKTERNSTDQPCNTENGRYGNDTATGVTSASSGQTSHAVETTVEVLNDPYSVHVTNPKHSEYATVYSRARSFTSMWPSHLDQTPQQMANAGFFYTGEADITTCFACGGHLYKWEVGDEPCLEHTRWYPNCEYIQKLKGSRYVDMVSRFQEQRLAEQRRNAEHQAQRRQATTNETEVAISTAAEALFEMGYPSEIIEDALLAVMCRGHNFVSSEQALSWILEQEEQEKKQPLDTASLKADNEKMEQTLLCKVCLQIPHNTLLLPCRHLVCCESCASVLWRCPICRRRKERSVKISTS